MLQKKARFLPPNSGAEIDLRMLRKSKRLRPEKRAFFLSKMPKSSFFGADHAKIFPQSAPKMPETVAQISHKKLKKRRDRVNINASGESVLTFAA